MKRNFSSIKQGLGGRHSDSGKSIAIFGATGFLGRYVVNNLGRSGWTIHIACRGDDMEWRHLKPLCDHGKLHAHYFSAKDQDSVEAAIPFNKVDVVLNLVGKTYETKHLLPWIVNNTFEDTNVLAAQMIARSARRMNAKHFVQMSCAKVDLNSDCEWASTKARGDLAVAQEFPGACIVRPGQMYGAEDSFLNTIAKKCLKNTTFRIVNGASNELNPVNVLDVAQALTTILDRDDIFAGEMVHLLGKHRFTLKQIIDFVDNTLNTSRTRQFVDYDENSPLVQWPARLANLLPNPKRSPDQIKQWGLNDIIPEHMGKSWKDVGVTPVKFENKAYNVLFRYRRGGHFKELRKLEADLQNAGPVHVNHIVGSSTKALK